MQPSFKRVPAVDKTFAILDLLAKSKESLGISDITRALNFNKSTVFNISHTLADLQVLKQAPDNKFSLGIKFYLLGRASRIGSEIISTVHPYLERINQKTNLSVFLGVRSDWDVIIVDKVDAAFDIKISSEIGMRLPLLAGAGGKAILSRMSERAIDRILSKKSLQRYTRYSVVDKIKYKKMLKMTRQEGFAVDKEEYIEGIRALAVPLNINRGNSQFAIWAVGLKRQIADKVIDTH
ncbi:MAG: IclR family transcriptional regulator, partial [Desulfobacterales bacterium]